MQIHQRVFVYLTQSNNFATGHRRQILEYAGRGRWTHSEDCRSVAHSIFRGGKLKILKWTKVTRVHVYRAVINIKVALVAVNCQSTTQCVFSEIKSYFANYCHSTRHVFECIMVILKIITTFTRTAISVVVEILADCSITPARSGECLIGITRPPLVTLLTLDICINFSRKQKKKKRNKFSKTSD